MDMTHRFTTDAPLCGYAEKAYFGGDHCQHCADRDEFLRLRRARRVATQAIERRRNGRARFL